MLNIVAVEDVASELLCAVPPGYHVDYIVRIQNEGVFQSCLYAPGGNAVAVQDKEPIAVNVDWMEPTSAAILERPDLRGVEPGPGVDTVGVKETFIDLPCAITAIEFEVPGGDRLLAVEDGQGGLQHRRHGAVVNCGIQHIKPHEGERVRGVHAVWPTAVGLNQRVVEKDVCVWAGSVEGKIDHKFDTFRRRERELVGFNRRFQQGLIAANDLERTA